MGLRTREEGLFEGIAEALLDLSILFLERDRLRRESRGLDKGERERFLAEGIYESPGRPLDACLSTRESLMGEKNLSRRLPPE